MLIENENTTEFDKFIGTLVKTFISVVSLFHLDLRLVFHLSQEYVGEGCYFNTNSKMGQKRFAYMKAS